MSQQYVQWAGKEAQLNDRGLELLVDALVAAAGDRPASRLVRKWQVQYEQCAALATISLADAEEKEIRDLQVLLKAFLIDLDHNLELYLGSKIDDIQAFRSFTFHVIRPTAYELFRLVED